MKMYACAAVRSRVLKTWALTHRSVQIHVAKAAGEQQAHFHVGLVCIPNAHAIVCNDCPHGIVPSIIPLLFAKLQDLLQLLPQVPISFCHERQLAELTNCKHDITALSWLYHIKQEAVMDADKGNSLHRMILGNTPLFLTKVQDLLQLLPQVPISFCHQRQLAELTNCRHDITALSCLYHVRWKPVMDANDNGQ